MSRSVILLLLLAVGAQLPQRTTADVYAAVSYQQSLISSARAYLAYIINVDAASLNTTTQATIAAVTAILNYDLTYLMPPYTTDSVTSASARSVSSAISSIISTVNDLVANYQNIVSNAFQLAIDNATVTLNANQTAAFGNITVADTNVTNALAKTSSTYKLACWYKYSGSAGTLVANAGTAFVAFLNTELGSFGRTLTTLNDYVYEAAYNYRSLYTSLEYCMSFLLTRVDLKNRANACFQSLLTYAIPQLQANMAYQQNIVKQLALLEAGNALVRMQTGFNSTAFTAIAGAQQLTVDVANCFTTGT